MKKIIKKYVDYGQVEKICHTGMLVIGTYDNFTRGNPVDFLENINKHFRIKNELFFIEKNRSHLPTKRTGNCRNNFKIFAKNFEVIKCHL